MLEISTKHCGTQPKQGPNMEPIPKIESVTTISASELLVRFDNTQQKIYDITPLLSLQRFEPLRNPAFFRGVCVDPGGYGISWNDDIDLSEFELWTRGKEVPELRLHNDRRVPAANTGKAG